MPLIITVFLLLTCIVLFTVNRPRMDAVALMALIALPLAGVISVPEALAGFSDPNVILIAGLFVVGEGLVRTGVAYQVGEFLAERAGKNEGFLLAMVMIAVAGLGAVMSSTGIVAIFIPIILTICTRLKVAPGRLMMPLSFAGLISGMMTLIGTAPNLVLDGALKQAGEKGFGFFSFTPIGVVVLALGVAYMLVARRWLVKSGEAVPEDDRRRLQNLIDEYQLGERGHSLRILPHSPIAGHTLAELGLRRNHRANVVGILRQARFHRQLMTPHAQMELKAGDTLLVDMSGSREDLKSLAEELRVEVLGLKGGFFSDRSREVGMAEVLLPPESSLLRKTVREAEFRDRNRLNVVGVKRSGVVMGDDFLDHKLREGDTLLVVGKWKAIQLLQAKHRDFVVLSLPAEIDSAAPALHEAPFAMAAVALMIVLMVSGAVPNVLAVLIACMVMGAFRCVDMNSAYKSIHWQSLIVIIGMMPFALALQKTGGIEMAAGAFTQLFDDASPRVLLAGLFVLTAVTGMFISNTATAVLMAPLAITIAQQAGVSPRPFAMTVAIAASAAFMAPISSPVNMLVYGPGQYRFMDFVKVGVPFTLLVLVATVLMVPMLFPL